MEELTQTIIAVLEQQKRSAQWTKDGGQYSKTHRGVSCTCPCDSNRPQTRNLLPPYPYPGQYLTP